MIDHNDTGATGRPWSYDIQHGPNGEEIYAWVYYHNLMVCTVKVHHARLIVEAVNAYEPLKARLAEVERERDEALERLAMADASLLLETGAGINTHETMLRVSKRWCARAHAAEARVAVLEKDQTRLISMARALLKHTNPFNVNEGHSQQWMAVYDECNRQTLAAEQKEAGK